MGILHDCHQPRNEDCPHNHDTSADCTCKQSRTRKPYRCIKVNGKGGKYTLKVYPDGTIKIRAWKRRAEYLSSAEGLFRRAVWQAAKEALAEKAKGKPKRKRLVKRF